ncbi:MAG TPA: hypothetical protein PKH54_07860 [Myxococcota bacterium]|mgnify:CR=1 FL=1|nr:hypothetical protein [Myxococcota bacterium]HOA12442.1 hypothetical protein [Myxococcota bacterium]HOC99845.1 hypothetical protein [Myxococcota bacterium]HOH75747.1 hypothetical protein [Myxococcota bacterium]HPV03307.1 hypothetical protein [Myxococcota bacterium]
MGDNEQANIMDDESSRKSQVKIDTPFFCKTMQADMMVGRCIDLYVEANAFGFKDSVCFKCMQGMKIRQLLAHD